MDFTYTQAKKIILALGKFKIEAYKHYGLTVINTEKGTYAIGTDEECDDAWDNNLDKYLEEVIYPQMPEGLVFYFDDESWKRDARYDGRAVALSNYDGNELEIADLFAFRID